MEATRLMFGLLLAGSASAGLPDNFPSVTIKGIKGDMAMPLYGLGTWQYNSSRAQHAVELAFGMGYRHVDTAYIYENQVGVGAALKGMRLHREQFFVTSKIPGGLNASASKAALGKSLQDLGLEYVDLMLLHFPFDLQGQGSPAARKEQWQLLQDWALAGKAKAVGVSHYCRHHVDDILPISKVPVAVNQVQYHVGMGNAVDTANDDKAFFEQKGILYQSFSPLCGPCSPPDNTELLKGDLVTKIGKSHNKSAAQVALKWLVQQGIPVIPKTDLPAHLKENMELFDWTLTADDMRSLSAVTSPAVGGGPSATDSGDCGTTQEADYPLVV